ncbi:MAG: M50 family metallopeptidase [bacterium]|nr:M50 family metallopeptidase [bacterium]
MLIVILVIIGLSVLILGHEAGHFFAAKAFGLKVEEFGFGFPPRIFAKKKGETEYSVNWLPFGGFVKIAGENDRISGENDKLESLSPEEKKRIFMFQTAWKKSVIILAGVATNFVIGWLLISGVFMAGVPTAVVITDVVSQTPAEKAGILPGDVVSGYLTTQEFIDFVNENRGQEIVLNIARGEENLTFNVTPRIETDTPSNEGALGIGLVEAGFESHGFFNALWGGLKQTASIFWLTIVTFYQLVVGIFTSGELLAGVVGPVGIFGIAKQAGQIGLIYLVQLTALISINLAAINLIPFPALDGGRFALILVEKIKGSPVPLKAEQIINGVGFALLILLMVALTARDVVNLF